MEIKLTSAEAVVMFNAWYTELAANRTARAVESGHVKLDSVPSTRGAVHTMDGALVIVWYRAANEPTERAIREASVATQVMNLPRQMYTGKLIDIIKGADGTVYFKVMAVERRDERRQGMPAFRSFNPSKGQLIEMTVNPAAATLATLPAAVDAIRNAAVMADDQPTGIPPVEPLPAGVAVRRDPSHGGQ